MKLISTLLAERHTASLFSCRPEPIFRDGSAKCLPIWFKRGYTLSKFTAGPVGWSHWSQCYNFCGTNFQMEWHFLCGLKFCSVCMRSKSFCIQSVNHFMQSFSLRFFCGLKLIENKKNHVYKGVNNNYLLQKNCIGQKTIGNIYIVREEWTMLLNFDKHTSFTWAIFSDSNLLYLMSPVDFQFS